MPLLRTIFAEDVCIGIWKMTESVSGLEELISMTETDRNEWVQFSSERRKREFITTRVLLAGLLGFYPEIFHDPHRKPSLLNSDKHLSISHSGSMVAVILSDSPAGIDVEETTRDVTNIAGRFLDRNEIEWTAESADTNTDRIFCWSMKESVYKMLGIKNLDFRAHLQIDPTEFGTSGISAVTHRVEDDCQKINVNYLKENNNVITWCTMKNQSPLFNSFNFAG
jgi:4'-phosphopantetheinyl transferase